MKLKSLVAVCLALIAGANAVARACPLCDGPTLTLSETIGRDDRVVLTRFVKTEAQVEGPVRSRFEIVEIHKMPEGDNLAVGDVVSVSRLVEGEPNDLFLLTSSLLVDSAWDFPLAVTRESFAYVANAPPLSVPTVDRLRYFLNFLEHPDDLIANDAYGEFANAPYEDIKALAEEFPADLLLGWILEPEPESGRDARIGLYGLMLGMCGEPDDALALEPTLSQNPEDIRLGIDGVTAGYLVIAGEEGLPFVEAKLHDFETTQTEAYYTLKAIRFMASYEQDRIARERLCQSLYPLLERPEWADLVLADLARWRDWSIQRELFELYSAEQFDDFESVKRSIIKYLIASTKDRPDEAEAPLPEHVVEAQAMLDELRARDPEIVERAERFNFQ